jgi:hypothetical protein
VSSSVLALLDQTETRPRYSFAVASVLIIYWLVHVCVEALADRLITPSCGRRPGWARALRTEVSIIWGGIPALVVVGVSFLLGAPVQRATTLAQSVTVALLAVAGISVATARAEWDGGW